MAKIKSICLVGFESNSERPLTDEEKYSRLGFSVSLIIHVNCVK